MPPKPRLHFGVFIGIEIFLVSLVAVLIDVADHLHH